MKRAGGTRGSKAAAACASLALVALVLACGSAAPGHAPSSTPWGSYYYTIDRDVVAEATGQSVLFRGIAVPGMEYAQFGRHYPGRAGEDYTTSNSPGHYTQLAAQGFNVVRVPFAWGALMLKDGRELNETYLSELDAIVNEHAAPSRLYVILDMHSYLRYWDGPNDWARANESPRHQALLVETWRLLARHYADNPTVLGYEIMNEPNPEDGDDNWPAIAQQVIDAIRTVDQRHLIFVGGRSWSDSTVWDEVNGPAPFVRDPISPPRLVYVAHVYFSPEGTDRYQGAWPDMELMHRRLEPLARWSRANGVPVWIGESGVPDTPEWAELLDCAFKYYYDPLGWGHLYWEASVWSRDLTRLGRHTLAVLQQHQSSPSEARSAPTCNHIVR